MINFNLPSKTLLHHTFKSKFNLFCFFKSKYARFLVGKCHLLVCFRYNNFCRLKHSTNIVPTLDYYYFIFLLNNYSKHGRAVTSRRISMSSFHVKTFWFLLFSVFRATVSLPLHNLAT